MTTAARRFTAEQQAAIDDRQGAGLLAANAGSGKTAVMVERFVASVLDDGVAVGAILALTFTEKAAGELRERVRRRFAELGEHEHARAAEAAWIGTIHGFCARVLRAHPLAAGLDPGFDVLDEPAARRLRDAAWQQAVERWAAARGRPALELLAAQPQDALRIAVEGVHTELRSRGHRRPALPLPSPAPPPDAAGLLTAARQALRDIADASTVTARRGRHALETAIARLEDLVDPPPAAATAADAPPGTGRPRVPVPRPGELDDWTLPRGGKALDQDACVAYREAYAAFRAACAAAHARPMLELAGDLLAGFGAAGEALKAERAAVDFEDLQLLVRDLLAADEALRARWATRFDRLMVDEFQDTNRLQLAVLEQLERDNLFAVGDEFQSIYGFRHADVTIFRGRAAILGPSGVRRLRANFRSRRAVLDVLNGAFAGVLGEGFEPLVAGREEPAPSPATPTPPAADELRLFDPDHVSAPATADAAPAVELLLTDTRGWDEVPDPEPPVTGEQPWRRAEARTIARRLRAEVDDGRRPGEIAVLVRAASSLRAMEAALEEAGLATYVVGGRGYWSQEQVRDGLAWLAVLANPFDEQALYGVLASPFAGLSVDGLTLVAQGAAVRGADGAPLGAWAALTAAFGRAPGAATDAATWVAALPGADREALTRVVPLLAAEREHAERISAETLLERAAAATGYDLAILARPGGERRLANLRKLMRLAREYERAEGRDLRGLLAYAAEQDVAAVREGEAALESEGLDAVRLMTIHRAKGLEFPVVCVADLGRSGRRTDPALLVGRADGRVGVRLRNLGDAMPDPALDWTALRDERIAAEDDEERRLLYVACTRAEETLLLSGGLDPSKPPAPRPGAPPLAWLLPALLDDPTVVASDRALAGETLRVDRTWDGRPAPLALRLVTAADTTLMPRQPRAAPAGAGTALPRLPEIGPPIAPPAAMAPPMAGLPRRLSYSSLGEYGRCAYRWYLRRVLGLPTVKPPPPLDPDASEPVPEAMQPGLDPRTRGSIVHALLEDVDPRRPVVPSAERIAARAADDSRVVLTEAETADIRDLVERFATSALRERLGRATGTRREARFAFGLEPGPEGVMVHGVVDVIATEPAGALVVDYKSDRLEGLDPAALTERDYAGQRLVYALAALEDGAPRVEVAHCYLERPDEPAVTVYDRTDAPGLREELLGLARGILAGEFGVTADPHHELCGSCPGRAALCSHPETVTLRSGGGTWR